MYVYYIYIYIAVIRWQNWCALLAPLARNHFGLYDEKGLPITYDHVFRAAGLPFLKKITQS